MTPTSASRAAFLSKKQQQMACQMCGLPRPGKREAGVCAPCFDHHLSTQAFNGRRQQAAWMLTLAERAAAEVE